MIFCDKMGQRLQIYTYFNLLILYMILTTRARDLEGGEPGVMELKLWDVKCMTLNLHDIVLGHWIGKAEIICSLPNENYMSKMRYIQS